MPQGMHIFMEPQCLVENGPDGKMTINSEVLNQLKSLDKEVVVVAIAGPYRTGKSYLMNKLAGQNKALWNCSRPADLDKPLSSAREDSTRAKKWRLVEGFALGSTIQSKTKGIWIWVREHPNHRDKYLVLLDTEGLEDVEKGDENHDIQILCLTVLLASTLVYNVKGVINNDAVAKLHFIAELSKHIQVRSRDNGGTESCAERDDTKFDYYFPDFVYAIRDFGLDLEIDGKEVTADEYLEHCLMLKQGESPEVETYNKIRSCIRNYFKKRKCFTFVYPVAGKCRMLDKVPEQKFLLEFREETELFVDYIFQESSARQIGGKTLNGRMFGSLLEVYVEQMRTGMPYVENAVDRMAELENSHAKQQAVELYKSLMLQSMTMPVPEDAEFSCCHNNALQKAIDLFLSKAIFDENQIFQKEMNEEIERKYKELVDMNEGICRQRCQEALEQHYQPIKQKLMNGHYTRSGGFRVYKDDVKQLEETYQRQQGHLAIKMRHVLLEFLHSKKTEEEAILKSDELVTAVEQKEEEERQRTIQMNRQKQEAERIAELQRQILKDQELAHQQNLEQLERKMLTEAEAAEKHYDAMLRNKLAEQQHLLSEGFNREADQMKATIDQLQQQMEQLRSCSQRRGGRSKCLIQ